MARILLIEDNDDNRQLMTYLLTAFGYDVVTASDGEEGLRKLQDRTLKLVICDVHLPKLDGNEIVTLLRQHPEWTDAPIIAVTALAMVGDRERLLATGFDGYVSKPIDPQTFVRDIRAWLSRTRATDGDEVAATYDADQPTAEQKVEARQPLDNAPHVLVVDDSQNNREMLRAILAPSGYRISLSAGAEHALTAIAQNRIDLILCDLRMPGDDGLELLSRIKRDPRSRNIPFLITTASRWTPRERYRAFELGALRFIEQPIEPHELLAEVSACLGASRKP